MKEKNYFVDIEDCQNNVIAIIRVRATSKDEATQKATRAYVENIECLNVSTCSKRYVKEQIKEGEVLYDEYGEEVDLN